MKTFLVTVNAGGEDNFVYKLQCSTHHLNQLALHCLALLAELVASVEIPDLDDIPRAV